MASFDVYPRLVSNDAGSATGNPGAVPAAGLVAASAFNIRVPFAAGAGTTRDNTFVLPSKARLIDVEVATVTGVASSTIQVWTAAAGTGTAASSAMATAAAGKARDALTTASVVYAAGATVYCYQAAGATLAGGEANLTFQPEQ